MKDVEILVRAYAMLLEGERYAPSMIRFLNSFSKLCQSKSTTEIDYLRGLFESFLDSTALLPSDVFVNPVSKRFNLALFEAVFTATCREAYRERRVLNPGATVDVTKVVELATDEEFRNASQKATTDSSNVATRLRVGNEYVRAL